jgi:hypothetical protein
MSENISRLHAILEANEAPLLDDWIKEQLPLRRQITANQEAERRRQSKELLSHLRIANTVEQPFRHFYPNGSRFVSYSRTSPEPTPDKA